MRRVACLVLLGCGRFAFDAGAPGSSDGQVLDDAPPGSVDGLVDGPSADGSSLDAGLIAHYRLDEASFGIAADSAGGHDAMCPVGDCPGGVTGHLGGGASFDGNEDLFQIPYDPVFATTTGFTIAAWIRVSAFTGNHSIIAKPHNTTLTANTWQLEFPGTSTLQFKLRSATNADELASGGTAQVATWHHVAGTWNGTTATLFLDGVAMDSIAISDPIFDASDVFIGSDYNGAPAGHFEGVLDDVRIYNRGLDSSEVAALAAQ